MGNGERLFELTATRMGETGYLFVMRDVTEARRQQAVIERLSEVARRFNAPPFIRLELAKLLRSRLPAIRERLVEHALRLSFYRHHEDNRLRLVIKAPKGEQS